MAIAAAVLTAACGPEPYSSPSHREPDYLEQILPLTGGRGVDVVLEMLANVNLDRDLDVLAPRGRVVVIGNRGRVEIDPRKLMT
ncbi:MAG TPA: zinc-binding dehydrogenase, partial [Longimicrobium sp.]|nr:zinc-binding dehydrogenase [Longimicrobium sp.]